MELRYLLSGAAGAGFLFALGATWRMDYRGNGVLRDVRMRGLRPIYSLWHGRLLPLAYTHRRRRITMLVSEHGDGELIAQIIRLLGYRTVRGSSTRGWLRASKRLVAEANDYDLGITPDGPHGPRHVLQPGAIYLAMKTGHPLVPITASAKRMFVASSWDRFICPLPGTRVIVLWGEPYYVPPVAAPEEMEIHRARFEKRMRDLTAEADRLAGAEKLFTGDTN